jgi:hypothetical protein
MKYEAICKDENGKTVRLEFDLNPGERADAVGKRVFSQTFDPYLRMSPPARRRANIRLPEFIGVEPKKG